MDQYSFLNTAHTAYFAELYDQSLIHPEQVEPSWRAFFQGFEFGIEESKKEKLAFEGVEVPKNILKEFSVVKLINAYRTRGHLFTKTNPVRDRRTYLPNLEIQTFDLSTDDLDSVFNAGEIIGIGATLLATSIGTLAAIGLSRPEMPYRRAIMALLISPMIVPLVITASGLFYFYSQMRSSL